MKEITYSASGAQSISTTTVSGNSVTGISISNEGTTTLSFSAKDNAGNTETAKSVTIKIDKTAPVISDLGPTSSPNGAGWYKNDVVNRFKAADGLSGLNAACQTAFPDVVAGGRAQSKTTFGEGTAVTVSSSGCTDDAGNSAAAIDSAAFKIDTTAPDLGITDSNAASYSFCGGAARPSKPVFSPTDALSGLDGSGETWTTPATPNGVGTYTYSAHAQDKAGNAASYGPKNYTVLYGAAVALVPYLQPINADGSSRFKLGSTIPVKFQALCNGTPVAVVAKMYVKQGDSQPDPGVDEAISTAAATTGNLFRFTGSPDNQYIFNLSTKLGYVNPSPEPAINNFGQGTWTLKIGLDDGTFRPVNVQLVR